MRRGMRQTRQCRILYFDVHGDLNAAERVANAPESAPVTPTVRSQEGRQTRSTLEKQSEQSARPDVVHARLEPDREPKQAQKCRGFHERRQELDRMQLAWARAKCAWCQGRQTRTRKQGLAAQATYWAAYDLHMAVLPRTCEKLHYHQEEALRNEPPTMQSLPLLLSGVAVDKQARVQIEGEAKKAHEAEPVERGQGCQ